ncbi:DNA repair protein rad18 [Aaosphaeria arxii CBS 175.79]|uniref:Postreplication repair E3 ubiquitin-protein ligase RAD18 n=1 Tax=Aaosphaeria arxii CBS 175.79 TaxID=1450172 RepID=A0A6A5XAI4_9PLEO|nr:DNA repair protein rad18 [Aaosphaeria arxii CBS 175.79]KAF2009919.1 DNA repair protein rad18 [Aaosphaeria arxii CBS 175.79]
MDPSFTLPDSTDWISTSLPAFEPLEAALRCEVCKEFYENPVITSCSHTFCSLCIRRCITSDGKCPTCRAANQADKLVPNNALREVVQRFQDARPKALELARIDTPSSTAVNDPGKKRKLDDTDIEEPENVRQTRSRQARSKTKPQYGFADAPIEVPDSEDEEEYIPDGMVKCPVCGKPMKEALVFSHLDTCTGSEEPAGARSTRSRNNTAFHKVQRPQRDPSPAPTRLPGLNYAMMNEKNLKKKFQELGIPTWGNKTLLIKRHTEWLHLWNSNCDASENRRKSKRDLLKELDTWERTQGGHAHVKESEFMKKDFDGFGHANTHKNQFDDLIRNARRKAKAPKAADEQNDAEGDSTTQAISSPIPPPPDALPSHGTQSSVDPLRPYEDNEAALASIRAEVETANRPQEQQLPYVNGEHGGTSEQAHLSEVGIRNPFGSPTRKLPMFEVPKSPVVDVEHSTNSC